MTDRQVSLIYLAVALVLLALMAAQVQRDDGRTALGHGARSVTAPVISLVSWTGRSVRAVWDGYVALWGAERERDRLRAEVSRLEAETARLEEARLENRRLHELLDLRESGSFSGSIAARVISYVTRGPLRQAVLVDRGAKDGVGAGWVVLQGPAVAGRVVEANRSVAEVMLITDPDSGVAVRHQKERYAGVLRGGNRGPTRLLPLEYVPKDKIIAVGDVLVTSGLDRLYPPGLLVGWVRALDNDSPLTWNVQVEPAFDSARLEEVLLIPPLPREEPSDAAPAAEATASEGAGG